MITSAWQDPFLLIIGITIFGGFAASTLLLLLFAYLHEKRNGHSKQEIDKPLPEKLTEHKNEKILYHMTDQKGWESIKKDGLKLKRGSSDCLAGSGIYFAKCEEDCYHKARNHGVILKVKVNLGRVKEISSWGDSSITFQSLRSEGYSSVKIPRSGGTEYVVYNNGQCKILEAKEEFFI